MLLFPYKADVELSRWPVMTLVVSAICIWVFARQIISAHAYEAAMDRYCNHEITRDERMALHYLDVPEGTHYCHVLLQVKAAPDRQAAIRHLADESHATPFYRNRIDSTDYIYGTLTESMRRFERSVPNNLTARLHYDPNHPTVASMLTAAFTHGSWTHLISNLIFFFAFAASVEVIVGYGHYLGFIVLSAVGTHLAYSYSVRGLEDAAPTVGLSGVVMAMMALLATIMPALKIRCFFWFIVFVRVFYIPALAIAAVYLAENVFDYINRDPHSNVNYVAHISGAAIGIVAGLAYRLRHREFLHELRQEI